jgi:hypothetical protein
VGARPVEEENGADHGTEGKILFRDAPKASNAEQIIVSVKACKTGVKDVRDLRGVLDREKAVMGVLISLQQPTRDMVAEAVSASFYEHKTMQEATRCTIGTYMLLSAFATRRRPAVGCVRLSHVNVTH